MTSTFPLLYITMDIKWYDRGPLGKEYILKSGFVLRKELVFNEKTYNKEHWIVRLNRLQRENFNRIKIPKFTYEMVDNRILFEIEFIKGRQLGATTFRNWQHIIKEDMVDIKGDWGFSDLKPENFIIEKRSDTLYYVDFECYYLMSEEERQSQWQKYVKNINDEIRIHVDKHEFWSS